MDGEPEMKHIRCGLVGSDQHAQFELLVTFTTNAFPGEYSALMIDNFSANFHLEGYQINMPLYGTPSGDDSKSLRPLNYPSTDVFIVTFSLVQPQSLEEVQTIWVPEIREHCPAAPYILVGLHSDRRYQCQSKPDECRAKGWEAVPDAKAEAMKKAIGARDYLDCSARIQYNVKEVFESAAKAVLHPEELKLEKKKKEKKDKDKDCQVA
jgi:GTPase SAR1 family protein